MTPSTLGVRLDVVLKLQEVLQRNNPETNNYKIAEKALDLCLNAGRAAEHAPYLYRNVWRNARYTLFSQAEFVSVSDPECDESFLSENFIDATNPEDVLCAEQLSSAVRFELREPKKQSCFDCLLKGMSVEESAALLHLTVDQIKKIRREAIAVFKAVYHREVACV